MSCTTGNCPECIIRVGGTTTPLDIDDSLAAGGQTYHLFIWYHENGTDYIYRGGPENGSTYNILVASGAAQEYSAPTRETLDIDWPFGNLITNRHVGLENDRDYQNWADNGSKASQMVIVAQGSRYCGLDPAFTRETRRIGLLGRTYNAVAADRTDNSNATVYTILDELGLPKTKPGIIAPGWGTNLHKSLRAHERVGRTVDRVLEPVRRFDQMGPVDQYNTLRRAFGG